MQSNLSGCNASSASLPVPTTVVFTSPLPISSRMLICWISSSSTTSRFFIGRSTKSFSSSNACCKRLLVFGLGQVSPARPASESGSVSSSTRDDLHRNVARGQIHFQPVQHAPAVQVRQMQVERDGIGLEFARQRQAQPNRAGATMPLKPLFVRHFQQDLARNSDRLRRSATLGRPAAIAPRSSSTHSMLGVFDGRFRHTASVPTTASAIRRTASDCESVPPRRADARSARAFAAGTA